MKKVFIIFTVSFLILIIGLLSCDTCGPFADKLKVQSLYWNSYHAEYSETTEPKLILSDITTDSVNYNNYSIFIAPQMITYFSMLHNSNSFSLINSAYACDPVTPTTDETIDSILIISNKDFDATHLAGNSLSELFDIVVLDQANNIYYTKFDLSEYLITKPTVPTEITLILKSPPNLTEDYKFTVKYFQDGIDNDYFEFITAKIVIQNKYN